MSGLRWYDSGKEVDLLLSIVNPKASLDPAVRRQISLLLIFGIPAVLACFLVAVESVLGSYVPAWVGGIAGGAEGLLASYLIGRVRQLRKQAGN